MIWLYIYSSYPHNPSLENTKQTIRLLLFSSGYIHWHGLMCNKTQFYCKIIIVHGGPMLVVFVANPCRRIYIPNDVINNHLFNINFRNRTCNQEITFKRTRKFLDTCTNRIDSTVFLYYIVSITYITGNSHSLLS